MKLAFVLTVVLLSTLALGQSATTAPGLEARPATPSHAATALPTPNPGAAWPPKEDATQPAEPSTAAAVSKLERDWQAAARRHDVLSLRLILAPDFRQITANGQVLSRQQALAGGAAAHQLNPRDMDVRIYGGQFAVVTGAGDAGGRRVRFSDVFVYRQGRWQAVSSQESPVASQP
jgi:hypothetical protein